MRHATIFDLAQLAPAPGCAWPIGEPGAADYRTCDATRDENAEPLLACYCAAHGRAATLGRKPSGEALAARVAKYLAFVERVREPWIGASELGRDGDG